MCRERQRASHNIGTLVSPQVAFMVQGVMCRDTVSVGWDGSLYDCDFNQQLALGLGGGQAPKTVFDVSSLAELQVGYSRSVGHN